METAWGTCRADRGERQACAMPVELSERFRVARSDKSEKSTPQSGKTRHFVNCRSGTPEIQKTLKTLRKMVRQKPRTPIAQGWHGECLLVGGGSATAILAVGGLPIDLWVARMATELDRWLATSLRQAADAFQETCWRPAADIHQTADGWLIKFDLAGVQPGEIELAVCGKCLTIAGVRRDCTVSECRHSYSMEINYNRFRRTIELPNDLNEARIRTEYRDGMLLVRLVTERGTS